MRTSSGQHSPISAKHWNNKRLMSPQKDNAEVDAEFLRISRFCEQGTERNMKTAKILILRMFSELLIRAPICTFFSQFALCCKLYHDMYPESVDIYSRIQGANCWRSPSFRQRRNLSQRWPVWVGFTVIIRFVFHLAYNSGNLHETSSPN